MKPHVFLARRVSKEAEAYIAEHCTYRKWEKDTPIPRSQLLREIADAEGLLISGGKIDDELLQHAPKLKVVSNMSVGYNNFDLEAMKRRNVLGTHTPHVLDETVADLAFALILSAARRVPELDRFVKEGKWTNGDDTHLFGVDVHGRTLGIIGMGRIGEAIARRGKLGFNMDVLYFNRRRKPDVEERLGVRYCELETLLKQADFIVLMVPLTAETKHMIGREQFALMKESAIFINTSRGKTVDEAALIEALENKRIRAAGLDVFYQEPVPTDNPLLRMPNVVTLPHIGSATAQTRHKMAMLAAKNLVAAVTGQTPPNVVEELKDLL
ncbi:D-glycerate dehydrogenase [Thermoactinomyces sp. CICC 10523]|uniref:2-hydroxyacid dehydrogenase n=1 Tax=Thermoactinomyces sp. CICC 10523 TaxID=2767428 RepID=UPI0018DC725E|nr:D-glycerate dehydrogenase [Thermoactinomyces sp. CICC 10523]MBH8596975.1 D-glycerate dehydrogenase [Thermoactinomyces sp. CICC 10523]